MKRFIILVLLIVSIVLSGCSTSTPVAYDPNVVGAAQCVPPETDNSYSWNTGFSVQCVNIDTRVFTVEVQVYDGLESHSEINASGSGGGYIYGGFGYASSSFKVWQDGKGLLAVTVLNISPSFHDVDIGDTIILKTSDLKTMALDVGAKATFLCNEDVEVISPVTNNQVLTSDRITYELDDCRMVTPVFIP